MRYVRIGVIGLAALLLMAATALPQANPRGFSDIYFGSRQVAVYFGRPSLKGRSIQGLLGQLRPGGFWRLGADESTTFTTMTSLKFGNVTVPRGTYSIWAKRGSGGSWELVFNHQYGIWGTRHDASKDFASVPLREVKSSADSMMRIMLTKSGSGGVFMVHWGEMELRADFTPASS
jgi:hypothetical protein